jgi:hypothetical protein
MGFSNGTKTVKPVPIGIRFVGVGSIKMNVTNSLENLSGIGSALKCKAIVKGVYPPCPEGC